MASTSLSWSVGPSTSRLVRILLNFAVGLMAGVLLAIFLGFAYFIATELFGDATPWIVGLVAIYLVLLARFGAIYRSFLGTRSDTASGRLSAEWHAALRWPWIAAVSVTVGALLLFVDIWYWSWYFSTVRLVVWALVFVGIGLLWLALTVSSAGEIDPETLTLTYWSPRRFGPTSSAAEDAEREIPLDTVDRIRRFSVGGYTMLWLSFQPGAVNLYTPRLLVLPQRVAQESYPIFEAGLRREPPGESDTKMRRNLVAGGFGILAIAGVLAALIAWGTGHLGFGLAVASWLGFVGVIVLLLASRY